MKNNNLYYLSLICQLAEKAKAKLITIEGHLIYFTNNGISVEYYTPEILSETAIHIAPEKVASLTKTEGKISIVGDLITCSLDGGGKIKFRSSYEIATHLPMVDVSQDHIDADIDLDDIIQPLKRVLRMAELDVAGESKPILMRHKSQSGVGLYHRSGCVFVPSPIDSPLFDLGLSWGKEITAFLDNISVNRLEPQGVWTNLNRMQASWSDGGEVFKMSWPCFQQKTSLTPFLNLADQGDFEPVDLKRLLPELDKVKDSEWGADLDSKTRRFSLVNRDCRVWGVFGDYADLPLWEGKSEGDLIYERFKAILNCFKRQPLELRCTNEKPLPMLVIRQEGAIGVLAGCV